MKYRRAPQSRLSRDRLKCPAVSRALYNWPRKSAIQYLRELNTLERLAREMADLIRFKTSTAMAIGFQRNGIWGEETASQKIEHLGLMFGALATFPAPLPSTQASISRLTGRAAAKITASTRDIYSRQRTRWGQGRRHGQRRVLQCAYGPCPECLEGRPIVLRHQQWHGKMPF